MVIRDPHDLDRPAGRSGSAPRAPSRRASADTSIDEVIAWHPQVHLAFRVNATSADTEGASVEELRIEPTPQGCRLTWTLAHDPKNPPLVAKLMAKRVMNVKYRQYLTKLRSYTDLRFGMTI